MKKSALFGAVALAATVLCATSASAQSQTKPYAQEQRPEVNSLGTTVMMLYVMVNCKAIEENDAILTVNSELQKLKGKGIEPVVQLNVVASAKLQAAAKATPNACAYLRHHPDEVTKVKQAVAAIKQAQAQQADQSDPYAGAYQNQRMKMYQENRQKFMDNVKVISFARHCSVINNYNWFVGQSMLQLLALQTIGKDYPPDYPITNSNPWSAKFRADVSSSWQLGAERSKQEGCEFWKQNPDIVYTIRDTAAKVSSGIGSLPYWFPSLQDANNRGSPRGPTLVD